MVKNKEILKHIKMITDELSGLTLEQLMSLEVVLKEYVEKGVIKKDSKVSNIFEDADAKVKGRKVQLVPDEVEDDEDEMGVESEDDEDNDWEVGDEPDDDEVEDDDEDDEEEEPVKKKYSKKVVEDESDEDEEDDDDEDDEEDEELIKKPVKKGKASKTSSLDFDVEVDEEEVRPSKKNKQSVKFDPDDTSTWTEKDLKKIEKELKENELNPKKIFGKAKGDKAVKLAIEAMATAEKVYNKLDSTSTKALLVQAKKAKVTVKGKSEKAQRESAIDGLYNVLLKNYI